MPAIVSYSLLFDPKAKKVSEMVLIGSEIVSSHTDDCANIVEFNEIIDICARLVGIENVSAYKGVPLARDMVFTKHL